MEESESRMYKCIVSTFHYGSIKIEMIVVTYKHEERSTFHYGSIKIKQHKYLHLYLLDLHSTMVLLKFSSVFMVNLLCSNLHSTMVLLKSLNSSF